MSRDTIQIVTGYGNLKPFTDYQVIEHGYDWVKVKYGGGAMYVPNNIVGRAPRPRYWVEEPQDLEEEFYGV